MQITDYLQKHLDKEFKKAKAKNRSYSLRSFAKKLGINVAILSRLLSGKHQSISKRTAIRIAKALELDQKTTDKLMLLFPSKIKKADNAPTFYPGSTPAPESMSTMIASEWICSVIFALIDTEGFRLNADWIATRLDVSKEDVQRAIQTMINSGMIHVDFSGIITSPDIYSHHLASRDSQLKMHIQNLHMIGKSLATPEMAPDIVACLSHLSSSPEKIKEARNMIKEFFDRLTTFLDLGEPKTEVYNVCYYICPVTKKQKSFKETNK